eukprot:scaffold8850_cov134-Isochrysis_galbana.AAC.9
MCDSDSSRMPLTPITGNCCIMGSPTSVRPPASTAASMEARTSAVLLSRSSDTSRTSRSPCHPSCSSSRGPNARLPTAVTSTAIRADSQLLVSNVCWVFT